MESSVFQPVALLVVAALGWQAVRFFRSRTHLSHVPGPRPRSWWKGSTMEFFGPDALDFHLKLYREYGGVARLNLLFGEQRLFVSDPLALYHILVKDQDVYDEDDGVIMQTSLAFGPSLLSTSGMEHSKQRKMLNPVFSMKHMRQLLPMSYPIAHKLCDGLSAEVATRKDSIDMLNWIGRAVLEVVGKTGFGHSFDALSGDKPLDEYNEALANLFPSLAKLPILRQFMWLSKYGPAWLRRRIIELVPAKVIKEIIAIIDTIDRNSKRILEGRKNTIENGDDVLAGSGVDILGALMKDNVTTAIPDEELLGHMNTFIFAGRDTTTSAVTQALYVLANHPEEQAKLREEVTLARKEQGDLDYDTLMALPYLDAVCRECLRLYAPANMIAREVKKDGVLPLLWPTKSADGKSELKEIPVRKGTHIFVSILNANRNKTIWGEDAEMWRPERWQEQLPSSVKDAHLPSVYSQMMTFSGGKRACIGFKLAEMEMKMLLSVLIEKFVFEPGPQIKWNFGPVPHPVVKDAGVAGQLPLKVSFVRE